MAKAREPAGLWVRPTGSGDSDALVALVALDTFAVSVGPLPEDVDQLEFPAIQTYAGGEEVAWIQPTDEGEEEPELPAPVLRLVAPDGEDEADPVGEDPTTTVTIDAEETAAPATADDDAGADGIAIAALVVAIAALLVAAVTLVGSRRRTSG